MRTERWVFAPSELTKPAECAAHDEFVASVTTGPESSTGIIMYRNGRASNRFADGTAGIGKELAELAEAEEEYYQAELDEIADVWRNVLTDDTGAWRGWTPHKCNRCGEETNTELDARIVHAKGIRPKVKYCLHCGQYPASILQ